MPPLVCVWVSVSGWVGECLGECLCVVIFETTAVAGGPYCFQRKVGPNAVVAGLINLFGVPTYPVFGCFCAGTEES